MYENFPDDAAYKLDNSTGTYPHVLTDCMAAPQECRWQNATDETQCAVNGTAIWKMVPTLLQDLPHCTDICDFDACSFAQEVSSERTKRYLVQKCKDAGGVIQGTFCYMQLDGGQLFEVFVTFFLALLSLGLTGVLAIGDARAGLEGDLHLTVRAPNIVAWWYV